MHERSIPDQRTSEGLPQSPTGSQFASRIFEIQASQESDQAALDFDLPPREDDQPVPLQLSFNPNHVFNVIDPEKTGPSNRLMVIGNVAFSAGSAALATVQFNADDSHLDESLSIEPIGEARPLYSQPQPS